MSGRASTSDTDAPLWHSRLGPCRNSSWVRLGRVIHPASLYPARLGSGLSPAVDYRAAGRTRTLTEQSLPCHSRFPSSTARSNTSDRSYTRDRRRYAEDRAAAISPIEVTTASALEKASTFHTLLA